MAIVLNDDYALMGPVNGHNRKLPAWKLDLKKLEVEQVDYYVFYTPADVKKLARYRKISFVQALRYFTQVGIDERNGAGIYVPRVGA